MMSLSRHNSEKMRGNSIALLAPLWEKILSFKHFLKHPSQPSPFSTLSVKEELQRLQLEKQLLETEVGYLQKQLDEQLIFNSQLAQITKDSHLSTDAKNSFQRTLKTTQWRLKAAPARVIFRSFDTWNSSLWINVGEATNQMHPTRIVALNSPVVVGHTIVGILDYVGQHQSRVRLITNSRLNPSVRASRGGEQDFLMNEQIENLLQQMQHKKQLSLSPDDQAQLFELLTKLKQNLQPFKKSWYLAKGELLGSSYPSRAGQNVLLKGTGFNYDVADQEGDKRDLRNGKFSTSTQEHSLSILNVNDILVTTGMDGIFPPGFQVAVVTQVGLLKEGDYFYHLEAQTLANSLEELSLVFVLPPFKEEEIQK